MAGHTLVHRLWSWWQVVKPGKVDTTAITVPHRVAFRPQPFTIVKLNHLTTQCLPRCDTFDARTMWTMDIALGVCCVFFVLSSFTLSLHPCFCRSLYKLNLHHHWSHSSQLTSTRKTLNPETKASERRKWKKRLKINDDHAQSLVIVESRDLLRRCIRALYIRFMAIRRNDVVITFFCSPVASHDLLWSPHKILDPQLFNGLLIADA